MPGIVLIGAQWGDEGKGKATDLIGTKVDYGYPGHRQRRRGRSRSTVRGDRRP